jgi:hypothetical protein
LSNVSNNRQYPAVWKHTGKFWGTEYFESQRYEGVTRKYSYSFAVFLVRSRLAPTQIIIVHGWQIVMYKGIGMHALKGGGQGHDAII